MGAAHELNAPPVNLNIIEIVQSNMESEDCIHSTDHLDFSR